MCMVVFVLQLNQIVTISIVSPTTLSIEPLAMCMVQLVDKIDTPIDAANYLLRMTRYDAISRKTPYEALLAMIAPWKLSSIAISMLALRCPSGLI